MKKLFVFCYLLITTLVCAQSSDNALIIVDAQKLGLMKDLSREMQAMNPDDISTVTVFKSEAAKKYGSDTGVIIIVTKKYILDAFYKQYIQNTALNANIKSAEALAKIGIINTKPGKNQPYDELSKYISTGNMDERLLKIKKLQFLTPDFTQALNPEWTSGALEISLE
ncbi:MAG: hypothetical protein V4535_11790 [Bacteroidota bacterium]